MSQVLAWAERSGYWTIVTARASLAAGESVGGLDDHLNVFEDASVRQQFLRMWRSVADVARDVDRIAAFEVLSEPRVRCSSCNRMVSPEIVRQFYAEACVAVHEQDPDTPCLIGGAPFYHADTMEIVLLTDQPNTICAIQRIKHSSGPRTNRSAWR